MYISEFWCGVGATIFAEIGLIVAYAIYDHNRKSR